MKKSAKNFYIKKAGQRSEIAVWIVDGALVRKEAEKEFTNFGQHFRFPVIPEYEFWLDKESVPNERKFFLDHLLLEWKLMKNGASYADALEAADRKERAERKRSGDVKKAAGKDGVLQPAETHKSVFAKTKDGIAVWLVSGRLVRSAFDIDFTEGGHDLVYGYVPAKEVWIDDDISAEERDYIVLHELYERSLMKKGAVYNEAHKKASRLEWEARHSGKKLKENLSLLGIDR